MSDIGANIGAELAKAELVAGRAVQTPRVYPVGLKFTMEGNNPNTNSRRLTLDALNVQRGDIWFAQLNPAHAFMINESRFISALRIHTIKLNPFKLDKERRICRVGSMVMEIPGRWECPKCHASRAFPYMLTNKLKPRCQQCENNPELIRVMRPLRRPDMNDPECHNLYEMYRHSAPVETQRLVPRIWASYSVRNAPPAEAWTMPEDDIEGQKLEARSRERYAVRAGISGTVIAIEPRGTEADSGWRVYISQDGSANLGQIVRSPVAGTIKHIKTAAGTTTIYIRATGAADCTEACAQVMIPIGDNTPDMLINVHEGYRVRAGSALARPAAWRVHEIDGRGTLTISEGDEVHAGQYMSEGYTIRPIKLAMDLNTPGIMAISMETTHTDDYTTAMRKGWLSLDSMLGGLTPDYGYTIYFMKAKIARTYHKASDYVRV